MCVYPVFGYYSRNIDDCVIISKPATKKRKGDVSSWLYFLLLVYTLILGFLYVIMDNWIFS